LAQIANRTPTVTIYTTYYLECKIGLFDRDETNHLNCRTVTKTIFSMGKIVHASQIFDSRDRRLALVFDNAPHTIYIYYFWETGFAFYGRKDYANDASSRVSSMAISQNKLFVVL
jgi:hypothetical protein